MTCNHLNSKEYTYALFLRCPETGETQHGTVTIQHGPFLDFQALTERLLGLIADGEFKHKYTLIGMQIVSVEPVTHDLKEEGEE